MVEHDTARMKLAIVSQPLDGVLPPEQSSVGIWTYEVARRLAGAHDVTVHARYMGHVERAGSPHDVTHDGVRYRFRFAAPVRAWRMLSVLWERLPWVRDPIYASPLYYLEYALPLAVRIRNEAPDVVHIHNFTGFVPIIRRFNPSARIVLHMSCEWLSQLDERRMRKRIAQVDAVVGTSEYITDLVRARFPEFAGRCHTVYNGVDLDTFSVGADQQDERPRVLVFVGRVSPEKGVHDLVEAMRHVVRRHPDTRLDVIGWIGELPRSYIVDVSDDPLVRGLARFYERDYGEQLRELVGDDLREHVRFVGPMSHEDVISHIAAADLLVNPSYSESFGMTLVEAMACGTPVVATRVGGMQEIVTDDCGVLVDRDDPVALADGIAALLDDRRRSRRMGTAGRRRVVEVFSWDRIARAVGDLYEDLRDNPPSGTAVGS